MAARGIASLGIVLMVILGAGSAAAQAPLSPALEIKPSTGVAPREHAWSHGVSEQNRRAAEALFKQGNALLKESICVTAAEKYREALKYWDHPNIHYNLALALMNLDQPIETHEHLTGAIKYGPDPLEKERYEHAKNYLKLLDKQVARVKIRCAMVGASVEMNGQTLFVPPGEYDGLVRAGQHTIVARREGYVTNHAVRLLEGGKTVEIDLKLKTMEELTEYRRRWPVWVPWTVMGIGAAVAIGGGGLHYAALQKIQSIDRDSKLQCPTGCTSEPSTLASRRAEAATLQKVAVGAYVAGGVTIAIGGVLAFLNRAQPIVHTYDSAAPSQSPKPSALEIIPVIDPKQAGLVAAVRF